MAVVPRLFRATVTPQHLARGVADGPVPCAAAQVAAKLVGDLPGLAEVVAVVALEHRHDDPGRAVPALRAVVPDHGALHRVQRAVLARDPFHRDQFPAREHRQQGDATVDGAPGRPAGAVRVEHRHGAGPAVPFVAAAFRAHPAAGPQPVEQRGVRGHAARFHPLAVEHERKAFSLRSLRHLVVCGWRRPRRIFRNERERISSSVNPVARASASVMAPQAMPRRKKFSRPCPVAASSNTSPNSEAKAAFFTKAPSRPEAGGSPARKNEYTAA